MSTKRLMKTRRKRSVAECLAVTPTAKDATLTTPPVEAVPVIGERDLTTCGVNKLLAISLFKWTPKPSQIDPSWTIYVDESGSTHFESLTWAKDIFARGWVQVQQKMAESGYSIELKSPGLKKKWRVGFTSKNGHQCHYAEHDELPMAVGLAALKTIGAIV